MDWCRVCCTQHGSDASCPGELLATGPERHAWRVTVDTSRGMETYGVLVAPAGRHWRARVLTYPKALWVVPGGRASMKFVGSGPQDVRREILARDSETSPVGSVTKTGGELPSHQIRPDQPT